MTLLPSNRMFIMIAPCRPLPRVLISNIDMQGRLRTIVRVDTHYHIWYYRRDRDGTIRSMERDDHVHPTRRKANYALSDGRQYWKAGRSCSAWTGPSAAAARGDGRQGHALRPEVRGPGATGRPG